MRTLAAVLGVALLLWLAFPRYDWRDVPGGAETGALLRIDRWTGQTTLGLVRPDWGRWVSIDELRADAARKANAR